MPLEGGETRIFLKDHDTVVMRGWCEKDGLRIGFGECSGKMMPAKPLPPQAAPAAAAAGAGAQ